MSDSASKPFVVRDVTQITVSMSSPAHVRVSSFKGNTGHPSRPVNPPSHCSMKVRCSEHLSAD